MKRELEPVVFEKIIDKGLMTNSVANALTAGTTQTRTGGFQMTAKINRFTTVANASDSATLPALSIGQSVEVYNAGANVMNVFPNAAADTIDGGSGGAAVALTNAKRAKFTCVAANTIISAQLGVPSA